MTICGRIWSIIFCKLSDENHCTISADCRQNKCNNVKKRHSQRWTAAMRTITKEHVRRVGRRMQTKMLNGTRLLLLDVRRKAVGLGDNPFKWSLNTWSVNDGLTQDCCSICQMIFSRSVLLSFFVVCFPGLNLYFRLWIILEWIPSSSNKRTNIIRSLSSEILSSMQSRKRATFQSTPFWFWTGQQAERFVIPISRSFSLPLLFFEACPIQKLSYHSSVLDFLLLIDFHARRRISSIESFAKELILHLSVRTCRSLHVLIERYRSAWRRRWFSWRSVTN